MQYVLVTGASTGIGFAIAEYFIEKGLKVIGSVRKESDADQLSQKFGDRVYPLIFDVTDISAIERGFHKVSKMIGDDQFIGIINNAGIAVNGPLLHIPIDRVAHQLDVNVLGVLRVIQTFFPLLKRQESGLKERKKIINIGSVSGLFAAPFVGPYCASKFALEAISDALRREMFIYPHIDVAVIEPGPIATPIWEKAKSENDDMFLITDYKPFIAQKNKSIARSERNAIPARNVAILAYQMLRANRAPTRKIIMKGKWIFNLIKNVLPTRLVDHLIKKNLTKSI